MDTLTSPNARYRRRPLAKLFSDLWRDSATLLREETELAKAEIAEKAAAAGTGVASLAVGGAVLFAGFLLVLLAAVSGLAQFLPDDQAPWLAPLVVGVAVLVAGWLLLAAGRNKLKSESLKPLRSARSVRRDAEVVKEHLK